MARRIRGKETPRSETRTRNSKTKSKHRPDETSSSGATFAEFIPNRWHRLKQKQSIPERVWKPEPPPDGWPAPMSEDARYGIAGEFLKMVEPRSEADPHAMIAQLYAGFGNIVGSNPHLKVEKTRHGTNLFVAVVGDTSKARKGTSWDRVLSILRPVDEEWLRDRVNSGASSGEGIINAVRDRSSPADPGIDDKRLLVFESDFSRALRAMERTGNTLSPILRSCWDGGDLSVLTKNSPLHATSTHVSCVVQTNGYELSESVGKSEIFGGLGNRFLWISARRLKLLPFGDESSGKGLRELSDRLRSAAIFARGVGRLELSMKARSLWIEEYPRLSSASPGLLGAMTSRAEPQVLRMAAICALMNESDTIRLPHLRVGLAIWEYALASARFLFGNTQTGKFERRLQRILEKAQGGLTRTEISSALNHHANADQIASALERLKERGLAKSKNKLTPGRRAELWFAKSMDE